MTSDRSWAALTAEAIYADECLARMCRGTAEEVLFGQYHSSCTRECKRLHFKQVANGGRTGKSSQGVVATILRRLRGGWTALQLDQKTMLDPGVKLTGFGGFLPSVREDPRTSWRWIDRRASRG